MSRKNPNWKPPKRFLELQPLGKSTKGASLDPHEVAWYGAGYAPVRCKTKRGHGTGKKRSLNWDDCKPDMCGLHGNIKCRY